MLAILRAALLYLLALAGRRTLHHALGRPHLVEHSNRPLVGLMLSIRATPAGCRKRKDERADVTTDGQVSLSNGTLQRKRTLYGHLATSNAEGWLTLSPTLRDQ
jgi:hypothetical protein